MPKGTSRAEVTSSSEKIKLVTLDVIELFLAEGIRVSQKKIPLNFLKIPWQLFERISDRSESLLGLMSNLHHKQQKFSLVSQFVKQERFGKSST